MVLPLSGERNTVEYSCLKVWIKTEIVSDNLMVYPGGGGGTAIYGLYRYMPLWRVWFSSSLLRDRVYKSESLGLEYGIIFQETDQLVEDFI